MAPKGTDSSIILAAHTVMIKNPRNFAKSERRHCTQCSRESRRSTASLRCDTTRTVDTGSEPQWQMESPVDEHDSVPAAVLAPLAAALLVLLFLVRFEQLQGAGDERQGVGLEGSAGPNIQTRLAPRQLVVCDQRADG